MAAAWWWRLHGTRGALARGWGGGEWGGGRGGRPACAPASRTLLAPSLGPPHAALRRWTWQGRRPTCSASTTTSGTRTRCRWVGRTKQHATRVRDAPGMCLGRRGPGFLSWAALVPCRACALSCSRVLPSCTTCVPPSCTAYVPPVLQFPVPLYPLVSSEVLVETYEEGDHITRYITVGVGHTQCVLLLTGDGRQSRHGMT